MSSLHSTNNIHFNLKKYIVRTGINVKGFTLTMWRGAVEKENKHFFFCISLKNIEKILKHDNFEKIMLIWFKKQ